MNQAGKRGAAVILAMMLAMGGCGGNAAESTPAETKQSGETQAADTSAAGTENGTEAAGGGAQETGSSESETMEPPVVIEDLGEYVILGQYLGITAPKDTGEVTEEDIREMIAEFCEMYAAPEQITEGTVAEGDTVYIDYVGKMDGVAFDGGTGSSDLTIGSGEFIPGFEEGLIGVRVGDTVDIDVTFPDPYKPNPDMSGAAAVFTVTVHYLEGEEIVPEFDDALAEKLGYAGAAELEADLTAMLREQTAEDAQNAFEMAVWEQIFANAQFPQIHQEIYDMYYENFLYQYESAVSAYGISLDMYLELTGTDKDAFYAQAEEYALNCMRQELVCRAVVEELELTVSEEEYAQTLSEYFNRYSQYFADEAELEAYYGSDRLREDILWGKVMDMVIESAVPVADESAAAE